MEIRMRALQISGLVLIAIGLWIIFGFLATRTTRRCSSSVISRRRCSSNAASRSGRAG